MHFSIGLRLARAEITLMSHRFTLVLAPAPPWSVMSLPMSPSNQPTFQMSDFGRDVNGHAHLMSRAMRISITLKWKMAEWWMRPGFTRWGKLREPSGKLPKRKAFFHQLGGRLALRSEVSITKKCVTSFQNSDCATRIGRPTNSPPIVIIHGAIIMRQKVKVVKAQT